VDFDFDVSSGLIYWAEFTSRNSPLISATRKLNIHRIKPDGSDYADVIAVSAVKEIRNNSALAIDWIAGIVLP